MEGMECLIGSPEAMIALGCKIASYAKQSQRGAVVFLQGALGAGKTTFVRGFLSAFDYHGTVKSPTYTLVEPYQIKEHTIYHFDFYRIHSADELELMGYRDYFDNHSYCLIEWPQKAQDLLPAADLTIDIEINDLIRNVKIHLPLHPERWLHEFINNNE